MSQSKWYFGCVRLAAFMLVLLAAGCREQQPPAPTAEEAEQLDEAEAMLNEEAERAEPSRAPQE